MISFAEGMNPKSPEQEFIERLLSELPHLLFDFPPEKVALIEEYWNYRKDDSTVSDTEKKGIKNLHNETKASLDSEISGDPLLKQMLEISKARARELGLEC